MIQLDLIKALNTQNLPFAKSLRLQFHLGSRDSSDEAYSFIITSLRLVFPGITDTQIRDSITDEDRDGCFDVIYINDKKKKISIFDVKQGGFDYTEINELKDSIQRHIFTPSQSLDGLAERVKKKIIKTRRCIRRRYSIEIYVIRGDINDARKSVKNILERLKNIHHRIKQNHFLPAKKLVDDGLNLKSEQPIFEWKVRISRGNNEPISPTDKLIIRNKRDRSIRSIIIRLRLIDIIKLQEKYIKNNLDLFNLNVRKFKGNKVISNKLKDSIDNDTDSFYILHNGLTFSCNGIQDDDEENFCIDTPQVINGCQTVNSIYKEYLKSPQKSNFKKATIICKIYSLKSDQIVRVCEATNTQLKIDSWDLRANDSIQRLYEEAFAAKDINYHRKITGKKKDIIQITELAQWIYACKCKQPAEAKNKKASLFYTMPKGKAPYYRIFSESIELETLLNICKVARYVKNRISGMKKKDKNNMRYSDLHLMAGIYLLNNTPLTLPRKYSIVNKAVRETIREVRAIHGRDKNYNWIFTKNQETWRIIRNKLLVHLSPHTP